METTGQAIVAEVDRLWPSEDNPAYRGACLAEEAGEVNRAITKRRHAMNSPDGLCKGKTVSDWDMELGLELAQLLGVVLDIAHRENIDLVPAVEETVRILQRRQEGT
jgi:NTP pyrophosphatase (non-canonical NTP hydrolase)